MDLENFLKHKKNFTTEEFADLLEIVRSENKTAFITFVDDPNSPEGKAAADYVNSHNLLPPNYQDITEEEINQQGQRLLDASTPIDEKKAIIMLLAHQGVYEALKILKSYDQHPDPELRIWAKMAIDECKGFVRQQFSKEALTEFNRISRTGRNDPCPCGSGKKFKKCCGRKL